jgi:hemoglobin
MSAKPFGTLIVMIALSAASIAGAPQTPPARGGSPTPGRGQAPPAAPAPGTKTLYQRLGGYDAIAKVVDEFLPKLRASDPTVTNMISGLSDASKKRNRQMIVDQICSLTGGPCVYVGRTMEQAHQGLEITDQLWDKSQKALADTLDSLGVKNPEKSELIAVIDTLRTDIVQKKKEK